MIMPFDAKCKWCGRYFSKPALLSVKSAYQGDRRNYCSDKCYREATGGSSSSPMSSNNAENNAELAKLEWEKEQAAKQEVAEKKARRNAKANELKQEGKIYSSFIVQYGEALGITSGVIGGICLFLLMPGFQNNNIGLILIGIIVPSILTIIWGFLLFKYLKEYFKK